MARVRAWVLPLAGLGLILFANFKIAAACRCGAEPAWMFTLFSMRPAPGARAMILSLALGAQIGLCLLSASSRPLQIGVLVGVVAILIAPDMSLLAASRAPGLSASAWDNALSGRDARVAVMDFLALFLNLATALYRSNAYILRRI